MRSDSASLQLPACPTTWRQPRRAILTSLLPPAVLWLSALPTMVVSLSRDVHRYM
jgi:hypothetical protein